MKIALSSSGIQRREVDRQVTTFRRNMLLLSSGNYKMEATCSSKMLIRIYQTEGCHIPQIASFKYLWVFSNRGNFMAEGFCKCRIKTNMDIVKLTTAELGCRQWHTKGKAGRSQPTPIMSIYFQGGHFSYLLNLIVYSYNHTRNFCDVKPSSARMVTTAITDTHTHTHHTCKFIDNRHGKRKSVIC
jgi:hypothetical protein